MLITVGNPAFSFVIAQYNEPDEYFKTINNHESRKSTGYRIFSERVNGAKISAVKTETYLICYCFHETNNDERRNWATQYCTCRNTWEPWSKRRGNALSRNCDWWGKEYLNAWHAWRGIHWEIVSCAKRIFCVDFLL